MPEIPIEAQGLFISCVDRALGILGSTGKAATLYLLETKYGISRTELAEAKHLTLALRDLFGLGSAVLLRTMCEELRGAKAVGDVRAALESLAREVEAATYGVEHGLV